MDPRAVEHILDAISAEERPLAAPFTEPPRPASRAVVLPSAFNPPTLAHLHLMQLAREAAAADHAIALLTTRNVSKGVFGAGLGHRVEMLLALHEDQPDISVFAANAARIADQAEALRACLPGVALDFIVGYDTLVRLFEPHFYADAHAELAAFFANHGVIAANRGDMDVQAVEAFLERPDVAPFAPQIAVIGLDDYRASISSTEAREAVANGLVPETVPAPVLQYIREHRLYR